MSSQNHKKILPNPNQTPPPAMSPPVSAASSSKASGAGQRPVLRVNQACNACRKLKMRCDGPENPPCVRCRTNNIACVFEKVTKPQAAASEQRLEALESQFSVMQTNMVEILGILRRGASGSSTTGPTDASSTPNSTPTSNFHPGQQPPSLSSSSRPQSRNTDHQESWTQSDTLMMRSHSPAARHSPHNNQLAQSPHFGSGESSGRLLHGFPGALSASPADGTSLPPFHSILPQSSSSSSQIYQKLPQISNLPALGAGSSTSINSGRNTNVLRTPSNETLRYHYELLNGSGRASVGPATSSLRTSSNEHLHHETARPPYDQRSSDSFAAPLPPHGPRQSGSGMSNGVHTQSSFSGRYSHPPPPSLQIPPPDYFSSAGRGDRRLMNMNASAVTSAANSDDEGDIPTEALVRPIHVLDTLANESQLEMEVEDDQITRSSQPSGSPSASISSQLTNNPNSRPRKRKRGSVELPNQSYLSPDRLDGPGGSVRDAITRPNPRRAWTGDVERSRSRGRARRKVDVHGLESARSPGEMEGSEPTDGAGTIVDGAASRTVDDTDAIVDSAETSDHGDDESDVVSRGLVSEDDARSLYALYFTGCYRLLACFNAKTDTYDSMRDRSAFCFCAILLVACKVRDGGNPKSSTQLTLERECVRMARNTIYPLGGVDDDHAGTVTLESIQAMLILAGWSHSTSGAGWLIAGHAIRCAVQLGVHKALPRLERRKARVARGQTPGEAPVSAEAQRTDAELITKARTWCALYVIEAQISFGTGRPAMMKADKSILHARDILLGHTQSTETDSRVVSTCELLALQGTINDALEPLDRPIDEKTFETVNNGMREFDAWLDEWDRIMGRKHAAGEFFRASAAVQRNYAQLFTRSVALRYIKSTADAQHISPEMKEIALSAIGNARDCIVMCVRNQSYRDGMKFAVAYTHTCAAFAGAFLLRFARLFPKDMDVLETISLVEELAHVLSEVPAGRFARALTTMLGHTRARLASEVVKRTPSDPALPSGQHFVEDGVDRGRHVHSIPPVLPIGFNDIAMLPQHPHDGGEAPNNDILDTPQGLQSSTDDIAQLGADGQEISFDDLQGLLGNGNWAPWFQNSMFGDLEQQQQHSGPDPTSGTLTDFGPGFSWGLS